MEEQIEKHVSTTERPDLSTPSQRERSGDPLEVLDQMEKFPAGLVDHCSNTVQLAIPYLENHVTTWSQVLERIDQQPSVERQAIGAGVEGRSRLEVPHIPLHQVWPV